MSSYAAVPSLHRLRGWRPIWSGTVSHNRIDERGSVFGDWVSYLEASKGKRLNLCRSTGTTLKGSGANALQGDEKI
jgi:hypothetical protein